MIYGVAAQVLLKPMENEGRFILKVRGSTGGLEFAVVGTDVRKFITRNNAEHFTLF